MPAAAALSPKRHMNGTTGEGSPVFAAVFSELEEPGLLWPAGLLGLPGLFGVPGCSGFGFPGFSGSGVLSLANTASIVRSFDTDSMV